MNNDALNIERLSKNFDGLVALQNVNLSVAAGSRRAIIGPNGAGKTTLFNLIAGEFAPSSGSVSIFGQDITHMPMHRRIHAGIGRGFQINNLFLKLSVLDNVLLGIKACRDFGFQLFRPITAYTDIYSKSNQLLKKVGLWEKRNESVSALAYGEQRQMEIVLALASDPRVLLLDEPTAGLSMSESKELIGLIQNLGKGVTIIMIAHDLDLVFEVADQISVLHYGQIVAEGTPVEIQEHPKVKEIYLGSTEV